VFLVALELETGTAVTFFFTCDADLFFESLFSTRRELGNGGDRRVLTFPSGFLWFGGKFDLKLFVGLSDLSLSLSGFLVGTREDAIGARGRGLQSPG
jgi:hypothetical protein